jgi:hypothetical protein
MFQKITLGILMCFAGVGVVQADAPTPVVIETDIVFSEIGVGTFTATAPLCTSGTNRSLREVANPSVAHGYTVEWEYTCDDNSGTFRIQYHPQAGANYAGGTREPVFVVAGPWSIVNGGTGRYAKLTGHGDFGVVIDFSTEPWTGQESFVGLVQLK